MEVKKEWAAIAAAVATVVTALIGSLAGLGEHAPGVVGGLLLAAPVIYLYVSRETVITNERKRCQKCMEQHTKDKQEMLERVLALGQDSARFMESLANREATTRRMDQIERMLQEAKRGNGNTG